MNLADHLLAIVLVVIGPLRSGTLGVRRLKRASVETLPAVRGDVYRTAVLIQWTLTAAVAVLWLVTRRDVAALGLVPRLTGGLVGVLAGAAVVAFVLLRQRAQALGDPVSLEEIRERMRPIERMLPHGAAEWPGFVRLSVTAGVCEELLYRGFLTWYFSHVLGWWPAAAVAAVGFGLAHAYQGVRGVMMTALVGMFLAGVYGISGSLYLPMVLHALMDLHSGHLAWRAYEAGAGEGADAPFTARTAGGDETFDDGEAPAPSPPPDSDDAA